MSELGLRALKLLTSADGKDGKDGNGLQLEKLRLDL